MNLEGIKFHTEIIDGIMFEYQNTVDLCGDPKHYPHTHEFCELYFYLGGSCSYMIENGLFEVTPGTVIFTRPGELHSVQINKPCTYERCFYQIMPQALDFLGYTEAHSTLRCFYDRPFGVENAAVLANETIKSCHKRLRRSLELLMTNAADARSLALADLLATLHEINTGRDGALKQVNPASNGLVDSALRYINENLAELCTTDELASKLYVSREYLSRSFSHAMGVTLNRYITIKRVELAKVMLQEGCSLDEVCEGCGWTDYSYFIRVFRRETGMTPMRYRKWISADE